MYGYQPPDDDPKGSWREVWEITRVAFLVLAAPLGLLFGVLTLFLLFLWALFTEPVFSLIPVAVAAAGIWYLVRRDRRAQAQLKDEIERGGRRQV
ncbi:MAG: hypothetical protein WD058_07425 [Dehalococcoidia bacterium]